jgi:hypothetical protein
MLFMIIAKRILPKAMAGLSPDIVTLCTFSLGLLCGIGFLAIVCVLLQPPLHFILSRVAAAESSLIPILICMTVAKFLSVFAFVTWIRPKNVVINQLFGGWSGISLIPITFDVSWFFLSRTVPAGSKLTHTILVDSDYW